MSLFGFFWKTTSEQSLIMTGDSDIVKLSILICVVYDILMINITKIGESRVEPRLFAPDIRLFLCQGFLYF